MLVVAGGCGRIDFDHLGDGGGGGGGTGDAPTCAYGMFGAPSPLAGVNSASTEWAADLSADGLELFFASNRPGGTGGYDIYRATRAAIGDDFSGVQAVSELNSTADEFGPTLSDDALTIYFASGVGTGNTTLDIYTAMRSAIGDTFSAPTKVTALSAPSSNDDTPALTADGLVMELRSDRAGGRGMNDIYLATRTDTGSAFGAPVDATALNTAFDDRGGTISADGLTIAFGSNRSGGRGGYDLYMATRATTSDAFGAPAAIAELDTASNDDDADLSKDGSTILFSSDRGGNEDIWIATRACL